MEKQNLPQQDLAPGSNLRNDTLGSIGDFSESVMDPERLNESVKQRHNERTPYSSGKT